MEYSTVKTIICPNCGANATNHKNCEYCGSLLIRFQTLGIEAKNTTYLSESASEHIHEGMLGAMQNQIKLQGQSGVASQTIVTGKHTDKIFACISPARSLISESDSTKYLFPEAEDNDIAFSIVLPEIAESQFNKNSSGHVSMKRELETFQSLESNPLFIHETIDGSGRVSRVHCYSINFGQDAETAAKFISEIIKEVYGIAYESKTLVYQVNNTDVSADSSSIVGENNIDIISLIKKYWWIILVIIIFSLFL